MTEIWPSQATHTHVPVTAMAGMKRKLSSGAVDSSASTGPAGGGQGAGAAKTRGRGNARGRRASVSDSTSSPPAETAETTESPHRSKRTRRSTRGESSSPRATRQSARLLSKGQANHSSRPSVESGLNQTPDTESGTVNGERLISNSSRSTSMSRSSSLQSSGTEPTVPEKPFGASSPGDKAGPHTRDADPPTAKAEGDGGSPHEVDETMSQDCDHDRHPESEKLKQEDGADGREKTDVSNVSDGNEPPKRKNPETNTENGPSPSPSGNAEAEGERNTATPLPVPALTVSGLEPAPKSESDSPLPGDAPLSALSASPALTASDAGEASTPADNSGAPGRRGGFRGRLNGPRKAVRGRARGRGGKQLASGRLQPLSPSMPPSPVPLSKQLRERQKELERAYRRVAAAQKIALAIIATRTQTRLVKDPKAHTATPLYQKVLDELDKRLKERHHQIDREYELKVLEANIEADCAEFNLKANCDAKIRDIRDEHITAAQGSFMNFIQKRRQAEDDDHTEPDESDSEAGVLTRKFVRGFDSSYVRDPEGAALFDRANFGWRDFLRRAKIMDDISPQMKEIGRESGESESTNQESDRVSELVDALMEASDGSQGGKKETNQQTSKPTGEDRSGLNLLADIALGGRQPERPSTTAAATHGPSRAPALPPKAAEPAQLPRYSEQFHSYSPVRPAGAPIMTEQERPRSLLPHYPPPLSTLPPSGGPQPMPHHPPGGMNVGMPRPLLPAPTGPPPPMLPPFNERLRLPDPFSSNAQHLPVPPGATYHLPLPHLPRPQPTYHPSQPPPRYLSGPPGPPPPPYYPYGMYAPPPPPQHGYGYSSHPPPPTFHQPPQYPPHRSPPLRRMPPY
ncbi:hypothetical protein VTO42DRAFT_3250 [Malbranchea cinnamomea]